MVPLPQISAEPASDDDEDEEGEDVCFSYEELRLICFSLSS